MFILPYCRKVTGFHTGATIEALERIINYLLFFPLDFNSHTGAYLGTSTAKVAFSGIKNDFAPVFRERLSYVLERIASGSRPR